jgi:16S rRNA G966 N2-methylase RsmD
MDISAITEVLETSTLNGKELVLPAQLSKELYSNIKEVLARLGGKWNKRKNAHIFKKNPADAIKKIIETKKLPLKNPTAFFPTPDDMIHTMFNFADYTSGDDYFSTDYEFRLLEPSAGHGAIASRMREVFTNSQIDTVEFLEDNQEALRENGFNPHCGDFLEYNTDLSIEYDYIFTNPPFSYVGHTKAYIEHIMYAYAMLKDGGVLVAIAPTGFINGKTKMEKEFYDLVSSNLSMEIVKEGFVNEGTKVETVIFKLTKTTHRKYNNFTNFVSYGFILALMNECKYADELHTIFSDMSVNSKGFQSAPVETFSNKVLDEYKKEDMFFPYSFMTDYLTDMKRIYEMDYDTVVIANNVEVTKDTTLLDFAV